MLEEGGERTRSHALPVEMVETQAAALGVPLAVRSASWDDYESRFLSALEELKKRGVGAGIFGDIDIDSHREWVERVCAEAGVTPLLPLWKADRAELLAEFLEAGFTAVVIAVKAGVLPPGLLGEALSPGVIRDIEEFGVDPSGEAGEYHTIVTAGPIFAGAVDFRARGRSLKDGYWFLDLESRD